jgi:hypothetical protein
MLSNATCTTTLWALEELAKELGRPSASGTGATAARERRRRAANEAFEEAASGRPSRFVASCSAAEALAQLPPPSPMTMARAKNLHNISTLGVPGKKPYSPKESTALVSSRRLAEVVKRRDANAAAAAQAKVDSARTVSLPPKKEKPRKAGLHRHVSQLRMTMMEEQPPEPSPPGVITSRTRESAVPYEPRPGTAPEGFQTMGGGTVLPGPKPFKGGGTGGLFGDSRGGGGGGGGDGGFGGTRRHVSGRRSVSNVSSSSGRRGGEGEMEDDSFVVEAKARVQTSATMSLMEINLAPTSRRAQPVDPVQLQILSRHVVHGDTLSLAGGHWSEGKGRALAAALNPGITTLTLADNSVDEQGAKALAEAFITPGAAGISTLDLSSCRLTDRAFGILAPALAVTASASQRKMHADAGRTQGRRARVMTLSLARNTALGDNGIMALTLVGPSTVLVDINLSRCGITATGAVTVAELMSDVATLERLTLSWNKLGQGSGPLALRKALEEGGHMLRFLDMGQCSLGRSGAAHIIRALASEHGEVVEELSLRGNGLEVDAALDIAGILVKGTGLKSLDVSGNAIGLDGAAALLVAAEAPGGAANGSPITLNITGCSLRHDARTYPPPPLPEDPATKDAEGAGKKGGGRGGKGGKGNAYKRVVDKAPVLPKAIVPGLYRCDLGDACGRAAAVMLCATREAQGAQVWRRVTLDGAPVSDGVASTWPEALPLPNEKKEKTEKKGKKKEEEPTKEEDTPPPAGPWLEVEIGTAAAGVAAGPVGRAATSAMSAERFAALWRGVTRNPAGAPSSEWLCDYARALANAGFFFTAAQAAEVVEEARFASARVEAAVALWPRVVDAAALTQVEARLGVGACRAARGRLNASHALRLANPTGRYRLHMSRAHDRSVAARLIAAYAEEAAGTFGGIRSRLVEKGTRVGDAAAACVRGAWLSGKPAEVGDVASGGGDVTAAAAAAWEVPTDGVLTIDYVSHAKRVARDAAVMPPLAFEELIARLTQAATTVDAATVAAAATAVAPSPVAPAEGGAMGVEGYAAQQHAAIATAVESERQATTTTASSGDVDDNAGVAPHPAAAAADAAAVDHPPAAESWLAEATAVADGTAFLESAGEGRVLTPEEVTAWHTRLGFAATLAAAETAAAAAAAAATAAAAAAAAAVESPSRTSSPGPPPLLDLLSGCVTEADLLHLLRCHELQPGAQLVRQFDPVALVPLAVMDHSPEGLLVELAGDTLEAELLPPPPAFLLRPGDVVDATAFVVPGGAFEAHDHPATLRAPREGEVPPPLGGKKAPPPEPAPPPKKGQVVEEPPPPPACVVLTSAAAALHALRAERPAAFESLVKAISGAKSSFPLGRGSPAPKPPKPAAAKKQGQVKKLSPAELEAERVAAIEAKVAALAAAAGAAAEAAGWNVVGAAAALELLRSVAAAYAFTAAQVTRVLRNVPWSSAAAAEDAAVTLFCRTVDPEAGFSQALRVLPAASQMRACQRLGWLNVLHLTDANMHFRLRLWRADERLALHTLLRMAHTCAVPAKRYYHHVEPGDAPYEPARSPPPGWRGVSVVPADGGGGGGGGGGSEGHPRLTMIPADKSSPTELSALFKRALSGGDAAARRVTVHFRFDITAEETRACAARWIQASVRAWLFRRLFLEVKTAVIKIQVMWRAKRLRGNVWVWAVAAQTSKLRGWRARARAAAEDRAKIMEATVLKEKGKTSYFHNLF